MINGLRKIDKGGFSSIYEDDNGFIYKCIKIDSFLDSLTECDIYCNNKIGDFILTSDFIHISPTTIAYKMKKGITLHDYILNNKLQYDEKCNIIRELFKMIQQLHNSHYYHGDIKPDNILLIDGKLKFIDFSFSKFIPKIRKYTSVLNMGSGIYRPPERIINDINKYELENIHPLKGDLWSFGVVCVFILSDGNNLYDVYDVKDDNRRELWKYSICDNDTLIQCYIKIFKEIEVDLLNYLGGLGITVKILPSDIIYILKKTLQIKSKKRKLNKNLIVESNIHKEYDNKFIILNKKENINFYNLYTLVINQYSQLNNKKRIFFHSLELYYKVIELYKINNAKNLWISCILISISLFDNSVSIVKKTTNILKKYIVEIIKILKGKLMYPTLYDYIFTSYTKEIANVLIDEISSKIDKNNCIYINFRKSIDKISFYLH